MAMSHKDLPAILIHVRGLVECPWPLSSERKAHIALLGLLHVRDSKLRM